MARTCMAKLNKDMKKYSRSNYNRKSQKIVHQIDEIQIESLTIRIEYNVNQLKYLKTKQKKKTYFFSFLWEKFYIQ